MPRIVIVGATSTIAQHCARVWAAEHGKSLQLSLIGRDDAALDVVGADLLVRSPDSDVEFYAIDFSKAKEITNTVNAIFSEGSVDVVLIAQGVMFEQSAAQQNPAFIKTTIDVNATSVAVFAEAFLAKFEAQGHGHIAVISSVAGDRGRRSNYIYGASKSFVSTYVEGMNHRCANSNINVSLIKPGPTQSAMTAHLAAEGKSLASPEMVARAIVRGIANKKAVIYAPSLWRIIMLVIKHLPRSIFNKVNI